MNQAPNSYVGGDDLLLTHFLATIFRSILTLVPARPVRIVTCFDSNSKEKQKQQVTSEDHVWKQKTASQNN